MRLEDAVIEGNGLGRDRDLPKSGETINLGLFLGSRTPGFNNLYQLQVPADNLLE